MMANQKSSFQVLVGSLYRLPDEHNFVIYLERTFSDTDVMET